MATDGDLQLGFRFRGEKTRERKKLELGLLRGGTGPTAVRERRAARKFGSLPASNRRAPIFP
jgi:hypothetical protein